jgi:hypothetical protein
MSPATVGNTGGTLNLGCMELEITGIGSAGQISKRGFESLLKMIGVLLMDGDPSEDEDWASAMGARAI